MIMYSSGTYVKVSVRRSRCEIGGHVLAAQKWLHFLYASYQHNNTLFPDFYQYLWSRPPTIRPHTMDDMRQLRFNAISKSLLDVGLEHCGVPSAFLDRRITLLQACSSTRPRSTGEIHNFLYDFDIVKAMSCVAIPDSKHSTKRSG
ncbi:hypothetical protein WG66_016213 [Moniliophthora roreri]|nr:hypothetical protein WG66_016213 [Moniliophthora roreri]